MRFLSHSEHFAHLRGRRSSAAETCMSEAAEGTLLGKSIGFAQLLEVRMLEGLRRRQPMIVIIDEQLGDDIAGLGVLRNHFREARALLLREVKLHVARHLLKLIEQFLLGRAKNVVDLVHLIKFIRAREQRRQRKYLVEHAANSPIIHLVIVVAVG